MARIKPDDTSDDGGSFLDFSDVSVDWDKIGPTGIDGLTSGGKRAVQAITPAHLSGYVNRDASLLGKVDFLGLIGDIGKGAFIAILSILVGMVLGVRHALGLVADAARDAITMVVMAPVKAIQSVQTEAVAAAGAELDVFGLFALPTATTVSLLSVGAVTFVLYIFVGGRLID